MKVYRGYIGAIWGYIRVYRKVPGDMELHAVPVP